MIIYYLHKQEKKYKTQYKHIKQIKLPKIRFLY